MNKKTKTKQKKMSKENENGHIESQTRPTPWQPVLRERPAPRPLGHAAAEYSN